MYLYIEDLKHNVILMERVLTSCRPALSPKYTAETVPEYCDSDG